MLESKYDENNVWGFMYPDGRICRYDVQKDYFAVGHPQRGVYSMFKPVGLKAYYYGEYAKRDKSQEA